MKTQKIVVHGITAAIALQSTLDVIQASGLAIHRIEQQGTKIRLFGPTGAPVVEYRAASFTTCLCNECKLRREKEASIAKFRAWSSKQRVTRLFKPSGKKARVA